MLDKLQELYTALSSNQIAVSIILTPLITGLSYLIVKKIPKVFWEFLCSLLTTRVEIFSGIDQTAFETGEYLLSRLKVHSIFQKYLLRSIPFSKKPVFAIGEDVSFYAVIDGMLVFVKRYTDQDSKMEHHFGLTFTFFTRDKKKIAALFCRMKEEMNSHVSDEEIEIYVTDQWGSGWNRFIRNRRQLPPKTQLQKDVFNRIISAIKNENFRKIGILLYGQPGCGKSALIEQIVATLGYKLYYFSAGSLKEENFLYLLGEMESPSIVLLEEIDCCTVAQDRKEIKIGSQSIPNSVITLATLLNVFDGLLSLDKQIIIATTNHYEKLDPALRRKGRFDITVELVPMTHREVEDFVSDYFQTDISLIREYLSSRSITLELPIANVSSACKESHSYQEALDILCSDCPTEK